jgi:biopolymer transport protein ExbD
MSFLRRGHVKTEADLTPMLDLTFNLMTFFIMVFNLGQDVYDQRVRLPIAGSASPIEDAVKDRLVLNISADGKLLINNKELGTEEAIKEIEFQAELVRLNLRATNAEASPGTPLPTTVILRADQATPFTRVYSLITACQSQGFTQFDLRASSGPAGGGEG